MKTTIDTYDGWIEQNRVVIKGQKAYLFDNKDTAYFKESQTTVLTSTTRKSDAEAFVSLLTKLFVTK